MSIIWYYTTGKFRDVETSLRRALGQYARHHNYLKIGRTNDPERRWTEHQRERRKVSDSWSRMVVIYESSSFNDIVQAEKLLIDYARQTHYEAEVWNDISGSDKGEPSTEYIYVLLDALGEPEQEVKWYYSTGHYPSVANSLKRALGQYAKQSAFQRHIKIGRTNDPERRWKEHQAERKRDNDSWQKMIVIYASSSSKYIRQAEKELIDYALSAGYEAAVWNDAKGTDKPRPTTNYVYILLD
jgi:predicted GIY-YIG superfamily endonuclease